MSFHQKSSFLTLVLKYSAALFCSGSVSLPRNGSERHSESIFLFFVARKGIPKVCSYAEWFGTEFREFAYILIPRNGNRAVFSSADGFGTELWEFASILVPRNVILSCFLFRGRVRNGIPRFSVPRNNQNSVGNNHLFRLFSLPRNYFFVGNFQPYMCNVYSFSSSV